MLNNTEDSCKVNLKRVIPFIKSELKDDEVEEFLEHINECETCKEELELYYIIETKLKEAETEDKGIYLPSLKDFIINVYKRVYLTTALKVTYYAISTLVILAAKFTLLLQLRVWIY